MFATEPPAEPVLQVVLGPDVLTIKVLLNIGIGLSKSIGAQVRGSRVHTQSLCLHPLMSVVCCKDRPGALVAGSSDA